MLVLDTIAIMIPTTSSAAEDEKKGRRTPNDNQNGRIMHIVMKGHSKPSNILYDNNILRCKAYKALN